MKRAYTLCRAAKVIGLEGRVAELRELLRTQAPADTQKPALLQAPASVDSLW